MDVVPAENSVYLCANFNEFIYTSKQIRGRSYILVLSVPLSVPKIFTVRYRFFVAGR
jgi:hypothetical protein